MRYMATATRVLAAILSLQLVACATVKPDDGDPFGIFKMELGKASGAPEHYDGNTPAWYTEKVLMMYRDDKTGMWMSKTIKVVQMPDLKAGMCFKSAPGDRVDCFYITKAGDVQFENVKIEGYEET
jgi:hypothetical protein